VVSVSTNDPLQPEVALTVRADVVGSVYLRPSEKMSFGSARGPNQRNRLLVTKDPTEEGELTITDLRTDETWLIASTRKVEVAEPAEGEFPPAMPGDWIIEVKVGDGAPTGVTQSNVRFRTGLRREPEVAVPMAVSIIPPIIVQPQTLRVAPASDDQLVGTLLAVVRPDLDAEALTVEATPEAVTVQTERQGDRRFVMIAKLPASGLTPDAKLVLRLGPHTLEVPIELSPPQGSSP
jgi:hypothetical protein